MGISDFLKALTDKTSQAVSPGMEEVISAVPALIGAYEQGRGRPIGGPLSMLGQMGMSNAANRQQRQLDEGDVAARLEALSSRGLAPDMGTQDAIGRMTPKAAQAEISDVEAAKDLQMKEQVAEQQKQEAREWQAKGAVHWTKDGLAVGHDSQNNPIRRPDLDIKQAANGGYKSKFLLAQAAASGDPAAKKLYSAWVDQDLREQVNNADAKTRGKIVTTYDTMASSLPLEAVPFMKGKKTFDRKTLKPVHLKNFAELSNNPDKYVAVDNLTATNVLPALAASRTEMIKLAGIAAKVLPGDTGNWWQNTQNILGSRFKQGVARYTGAPNPKAFEAERTSLAFSLQRVYTGSTRPMSQAEFYNIVGQATGKDVTSFESYKEAVVPGTNDTKESAQNKLDLIANLWDQKLQTMDFAPEATAELMHQAASTVNSAPEVSSPAPESESEDKGEDMSSTPDDDTVK